MKNDTTNGFPDFGELREVFGHYKASLRKDDLLDDEALDRMFAEAPARISSIRRARMQWGFGIAGLAVVTLALLFVLTESGNVETTGATIQISKPPATPAQLLAFTTDSSERGMTAPLRPYRTKQHTAPALKPFPINYISTESEVRRMLADMQLGEKENVDSFYRYAFPPDNITAKEAVRRWDANIRVTNADIFQRKEVKGIGWVVTLKGRDVRAPGMDFGLSIDSLESEVRLKVCEMQLTGDSNLFRSNDMANIEAHQRWHRGIRVKNIDQFERVEIDGAWIISLDKRKDRAPGMSVELTLD